MTPLSPLRLAWVGCHIEGGLAFEALMQAGAPIVGAITLTPERRARRSGATDYGPACARWDVPLHQITDINGADGLAVLRALAPDIAFVIGWSQIVRPPALRLARIGMVGAHASLLPRHRGSAPVNWALINGETETGNSLIWLTEGVDEGAVIDQASFPITPYETVASLYQQVAQSNRDMLLRLLPRLLAGERPGRLQPASDEPVLPRRRPADGVIDWNRPSRQVYDFIRALTRPYPGAFSWLDGRRWTVWQAALVPPAHGLARAAPAGTVLGPVVSPIAHACGQMVACGGEVGEAGAVVLLELEAEDGTILAGRDLSNRSWTGKVWTEAREYALA
nr:bifunctional polymyxin resistance protein ArnA [uncultured bacterium]